MVCALANVSGVKIHKLEVFETKSEGENGSSLMVVQLHRRKQRCSWVVSAARMRTSSKLLYVELIVFLEPLTAKSCYCIFSQL